MLLKSKFIYNTDSPDGGAGGATGEVIIPADIPKEADSIPKEEPSYPEEIQQKLKEYEELKAWKEANTKPAEKSQEEIAREEEKDKAEFIKYSVDNDLFKLDELTQYESLKVKADADLVFEGFLKDFKEENPDITDEVELSEAAKEEFDRIYKLTSDNEKSKEKGLAKLAKEANEIRNPYETKIKTAQANYTEEKQVRQKMPDFEKFIDEQIKKNVGEKVSFKIKRGEEEFPIDIELTQEDRDAIAKAFKTPKTFYNFTKSAEETQKSLDAKINSWIRDKKLDEALAKAAEVFEGIGVKNGSNVGADNPFAMRQGYATRQPAGLTLAASNEKIAEARSRYN